MSENHKVRVAIIGVGNCASSLVQGVTYYRDAKDNDAVPGLMHVNLGGYHIRDIEFTAAIDVVDTKVHKDLSEAIFAYPNNTMSEYIEHDLTGASVGVVEKQVFTFAEPPHEMILENGSKLGPITIAYETYGSLAPARDNVVLVAHALSGDAHVAGYHREEDPKPGWWDIMVGPGKGIDTDKYFVVCSNILGSCMGSTGPSSLNPKTQKPYGLEFPVITVGDMVRAQKALMDHLGIQKILSVIGGSIGGLQSWSGLSSIPTSFSQPCRSRQRQDTRPLPSPLTRSPGKPSWQILTGTEETASSESVS